MTVLAKLVLIFGDRGGLGAALAELFLKCGDEVIGASRREDLAAPYQRYVVDAEDEMAVSAFSALLRDQGRIPDIVVNCAGQSAKTLLLMASTDEVRQLLIGNALSAFLVTREFAKAMLSRDSGVLVNFSSIHAHAAIAGAGVYAASKAAVEALVRAFDVELARSQLKPSCLALSYVEAFGMAASINEAARQEVYGTVPAGRTVGVQEVFDAIEQIDTQPPRRGDPVYHIGL